MQSEKTNSKLSLIITVIIVIALIIGSGVYIYWNSVVNENSSDNEISQEVNIIEEGDVSIEIDELGGSGVTIKQIPIETDNTAPTFSIPDIDRPLVFDSTIPKSAQKQIGDKIENLKKTIKDEPTRIDYWLDLGVQWNIIGDYEGAKIAWEYAVSMNPQDSTIFSNLGKLYHLYLNDFPKSEKNLLKAIENSPNTIAHYHDLHELYRYSYKQDTKLAVEVLLEGLAENPNNVDILVTLATYYKEISDNTNAKKYYEQAREEAQKLLGNTIQSVCGIKPIKDFSKLDN